MKSLEICIQEVENNGFQYFILFIYLFILASNILNRAI